MKSIPSLLFDLGRPLLSRLDPETAHGLALNGLRLLHRLLPRYRVPDGRLARNSLGLRFENPLGLAAGCDKNGDYLDALGCLGFGHIEVGTVTPRPQRGGDKPRLFRFPDAGAVVNRMGFNNKGIDYLVARLKRRSYGGIVGVSIGKNFDTPLARAEQDYLICLRKAYACADYFVINVSSPNTDGLRELQGEEGLARIAMALLEERQHLASSTDRIVPILVKIAPDFSSAELDALAKLILRLALDGVVAVNTTVDMTIVSGKLPVQVNGGGLSGRPLHGKSVETVRRLRAALGPAFPIIGVGGISNGAQALETLRAGADLIQIYTGFIYRGPALIGEILEALAEGSG